MTAGFAVSLRSRPEVIRLVPDGERPIALRVQLQELWDVMRVDASPRQAVQDVKRAVLSAFMPTADPEQYVMKLRGFEVLDELQTLADAGVRDGSIFLLMHRRRRPVR